MRLAEFLETRPEFRDLTRHELQALDKAMAVREYPDGYEFTREDTPGSRVYLLMSGEVSITHRRIDRGIRELKRMQPGELFGLVAVIDHGRRYASCKAVGPVRAAVLPRSAFELLFESNSPLPHHFQYIVARQLARDIRAVLAMLRADICSEVAGNDAAAYGGPERRRGGDRRRGRPGKTTDA